MGSFYDLLKQRRAVRSYTGERVPRETLERIARAARRGPNAGYSQGLQTARRRRPGHDRSAHGLGGR